MAQGSICACGDRDTSVLLVNTTVHRWYNVPSVHVGTLVYLVVTSWVWIWGHSNEWCSTWLCTLSSVPLPHHLDIMLTEFIYQYMHPLSEVSGHNAEASIPRQSLLNRLYLPPWAIIILIRWQKWRAKWSYICLLLPLPSDCGVCKCWDNWWALMGVPTKV